MHQGSVLLDTLPVTLAPCFLARLVATERLIARDPVKHNVFPFSLPPAQLLNVVVNILWVKWIRAKHQVTRWLLYMCDLSPKNSHKWMLLWASSPVCRHLYEVHLYVLIFGYKMIGTHSCQCCFCKSSNDIHSICSALDIITRCRVSEGQYTAFLILWKLCDALLCNGALNTRLRSRKVSAPPAGAADTSNATHGGPHGWYHYGNWQLSCV